MGVTKYRLDGISVGRVPEEWHLSVSLSNHNSEQDEENRDLWVELQKELEEVINKDKYKPIRPMS